MYLSRSCLIDGKVDVPDADQPRRVLLRNQDIDAALAIDACIPESLKAIIVIEKTGK